MNEKHKELYSRDSKGNIRVWWIEQNKNQYRTHSGIQKGEMVISSFTTAIGKNIGKSNETTPVQQATKEILAKYKDQESTGYFRSIDDIDKKTFFAPMLAQKYEDRKDEIDWARGNYISPKMDGLRAILTKNGATSRNGKPLISFPHIMRELKPLFELDSNLILDGEIYCDKLSHNFEKIISLAKKTKPTQEDLDESESYIQYWIFDIPSISGGFHERYARLLEIINQHLPNNKWIRICEHELIRTPDEIESNLRRYLELGFEGLMLNTYDGDYQQKRSKNILKYKKFQDCEAEILDIIEGQGNRSGMLGYAKLRLDNGKEFDANARGNEELYRLILKNKKDYIGRRATVRYQNLTQDSIPRFPVIVDFNRFD